MVTITILTKYRLKRSSSRVPSGLVFNPIPPSLRPLRFHPDQLKVLEWPFFPSVLKDHIQQSLQWFDPSFKVSILRFHWPPRPTLLRLIWCMPFHQSQRIGFRSSLIGSTRSPNRSYPIPWCLLPTPTQWRSTEGCHPHSFVHWVMSLMLPSMWRDVHHHLHLEGLMNLPPQKEASQTPMFLGVLCTHFTVSLESGVTIPPNMQ